MAWHGKIKTMTIRTPTDRDRIQQITIKNFNQNTYLYKIGRENTIWLLQGGKVGISLLHLF